MSASGMAGEREDKGEEAWSYKCETKGGKSVVRRSRASEFS